MRTLFLCSLMFVGFMANATSEKAITGAIEEKFDITTRSMWSGQVKKPGTVLYTVHKGVKANKPSTVMKSTIVENGDISVVGGGELITGGDGYNLSIGEEVYMYNYSMDKESITFLFGTVKSHEMQVGNSKKSKPYQLALEFKYDGGLYTVEPERVINDIAQFFATEEEFANADDLTLQLGQSPEQVINIMGAPKRRIELGPKLIFTYYDLKITFENNAVVDVQ